MKFVDVKKLKELIEDADDDALIILMNGSGDVGHIYLTMSSEAVIE
jgi:uncharacterized membrane-anchored protein YitT (DUF2179 family)